MRRPRRDDRGASVPEFVMITVLLVLLLFAVLQVAIWCYARNVVAAAAADGARFAATAPDGPAAGAQRAGELIRKGLSPAAAARIPCAATASADPATGLPTRTVRCHGRLTMTFLPFALPLGIDVHSSALVEAGR